MIRAAKERGLPKNEERMGITSEFHAACCQAQGLLKKKLTSKRRGKRGSRRKRKTAEAETAKAKVVA